VTTATVRARCPRCEEWNSFEADEPLAAIACGKCAAPIALRPTERLLAGGPVDRCWRCGGADFWTKKDFPQRIGLLIVAAGAIAAFWTYGASLVLVMLIDFALYQFLPPVTICYRCKTEYRGVPADRAHGAFDLAHQEDVEEAQAHAPEP
jgi:hypothetical protein